MKTRSCVCDCKDAYKPRKVLPLWRRESRSADRKKKITQKPWKNHMTAFRQSDIFKENGFTIKVTCYSNTYKQHIKHITPCLHRTRHDGFYWVCRTVLHPVWTKMYIIMSSNAFPMSIRFMILISRYDLS